MGEIIIKHRAGGETRLQSKQATVKITKAEQRKQLLGEDTFNITIQSAQPIEIFIGDRIEIFGSVYTINQLPTIKKTGTRVFEQTIILEGTQYELIDVQFILPGNTMYDNLTGDLDDFIDVLIQNANRIYPETWVKGFTPTETETKTLSFSERNCLEVLQTLCEEYSTEFEIVVDTTGTRTLHIKQVGLQFPFPFTYGRTGGLYQLTRQNVNSQSVVTRLYVYGGRNNLGNTYRSSKLCLPGKQKNDSYIEDVNAVTLYGVKENTKTFSDIFPARVGSITALGSEYFAFVDNTMFDLNEKEADGETTKWLIPGVGAKIRMQTGNLAGYEFDVHAYDHGTFELQVVPFIDESGFKFPSETNAAFQFKPGDKYIFTDINLPLAYITEAEEKLETEGEKYYNKYRQPQVQYSLSIHPRFLEKYAGAPEVIPNIFALGDQIQIIDDDIGVNKSLRITGFTRDALDPYRYTLTLSEAAYNKTIINRIISDIEDITDIIEINNLGDPYKARRNWMAAQELLNKIFDPEGYYYSEKIRPLSIETMMLQVGAKSQQFILQNTRFEPNHQGDPNAINIIGGQLVHYTLNDTITTWNLTSTTVTQLDPAKSYFVYAKCQADGDAGAIIIDDTQIKVDQDPMFYHFIIGHLSSVLTNPDGSNPARILSLTYGSTTINGRFIKTGRIESSGGGSTYFDLDEGVISGNIRFISNGAEVDLSDWADQVLAELEDVDGVISDLEEYIDGAFKNGIISEAEARAIEKYINQINKEKNELEVVYNKTYLNPLLTGTPKTNLLNAKITLFGGITSLLNAINTVIADGATGAAEKQAVDAAFATYSSSLDLFTTRLEEARISIEQYLKSESDGARAAAAAAEAAANAASQDVADLSGIVNNLDAYVDGAFRDGVIEEAEAKAIEKYLNTINETMSKAEASYNKVYANTYLEGDPKTALLNAKINLWGQRDTLLTAINTAIAGGQTTPAQKTAVDNAFSSFNSLMSAFQSALEDANKAIQAKLDSLSTEKVNNLEIGGRNLLRNSLVVTDRTYPSSGVVDMFYRVSTIPLIEDEYVLSFEAKSTISGDRINCYFYYPHTTTRGESSLGRITPYADGNISLVITNEWKKYWIKYTQSATTTVKHVIVGRLFAGAGSGTVSIRNVQLEAGTKATDWTPAPEDVQAEIDSAKQEALTAAGTAADALAKANASKAITDKFGTTIDGGLINTVITEFREADSEQVTGLISGIQGADKDLPFLVAGGTYAEGIAGTAKAIIRHDGTVKFTDGEFTGKIRATSGELGALTMQSGGYIDLPPSFTSRKGRLDNTGLSLIYDGANSQKIYWYSGLGTFAGQITCNSQGRLRLSSSFGIEMSVDFLNYSPISITGSGLNHRVDFGSAEVSNIRKLSSIGQLNMAYTSFALDANTNYHISTDTTLIILTSVGDGGSIYRMTGAGGASPNNGDVRIIVNTSSTHYCILKSNVTNSNIKVHADSGQVFRFTQNSIIVLVYYNGYWRIHTDWGQPW